MSAIGIDLGTTYCCVGVWNNDGVEIIVNEQGNRITASCVAFTDTERIIGDSARNQSTINAANTVFDVKRLLGQRFNSNLEKCMKHWSFKIVKKNYRPQVCVLYQGEKKVFSPEEIAAMILMKIKENVETYLGETVSNVVISVPACFNDSQRQSIKNASLIAGLQVLRIINEPTAAAMAYAFDKNIREERCILIYDLGGGSFDVSIITIDEGSLFEVKSCGGITHLGGEDFDNRLVEYLADEFYNKYNVNIRDNCKALRRLKVAAETAKRILSSSTEVSIEMDGLYDGLDFNTKVYRSKFEELCDDLFKSTLDVVEKVLNDAKVKKSNINDIILIGGSTRIPKIQQMLQDYFSGKQLNFSLNPDEAVAYGAATFAAVLLGRISPSVRDVLLVDIISFDIEIETLNGIRTVIVEHNTRLPYKYSQYFTTYKDNQTAVTLRLYESKKFQFAGGGCVENLLGQFTISGIQPAARGIPQIEVTFDVDTNGILNVSARENSTGQPKTMVVDEMQWKLSEEMINQMILDAQVYKVKDDIQREKVKARNLLESHIFSAKQAVDEAGDTLTDTEKDSRIKQCDNMLQWLDNYSKIEKDEFDSKMKTLQNICYPITFKINNSNETENRTSSH